MLNYYFDFEFIEGFKKPFPILPTIGMFNKQTWNIQMISVGIKCSDGREYYAISSEFNPDDASDWVKENVLSKLPPRFLEMSIPDIDAYRFIMSEGIALKPNPEYKSNKQIADEIFDFVNINDTGLPHNKFIKKILDNEGPMSRDLWYEKTQPTYHFEGAKSTLTSNFKLYGYYSAYDHVLLCTLFGKMLDLPKGFPMYTIDLKQMLDEVVWEKVARLGYAGNRSTFEAVLRVIKESPDYPKQSDEHHALADARWNMELHKFIQMYKWSKS